MDQSCDDGWAHKQCFCLRRKEPHLHQERYSYVGTQGTCLASSCTVGFAQGIDTGLTEVTTKNAQALKDALAQLPVSIAIGNDSMYLCSHGAMPWCVQLYSGDVLHFWCGTSPDHGVLAVGYGTDGTTDCWKAKNPWRPMWTEVGLSRLLRGKGVAGERSSHWSICVRCTVIIAEGA